MSNFEELEAFKRAVALTVAVYQATESFPRREIYGLTAQIRRAACSVVSQLAEGEGRLTISEYRQFLSQARGSLYEVEAQVIVARALGYTGVAMYEHLRKAIAFTARPLNGLIKWARLQETRRRGTRHPAPGTPTKTAQQP
jgi:four helix bundle protein